MEESPAPGDKLLLRFEEAARVLSLGRSTIYELVGRGELPVVRVGRSVRIPAAALTDWTNDRSRFGKPKVR